MLLCFTRCFDVSSMLIQYGRRSVKEPKKLVRRECGLASC